MGGVIKISKYRLDPELHDDVSTAIDNRIGIEFENSAEDWTAAPALSIIELKGLDEQLRMCINLELILIDSV